VGQRAGLDPCRGVADYQIPLGLGEVFCRGTSDVTGAHRTVDTHL
jgi:hypothetical protein